MKIVLTGERGKFVVRFCEYVQENNLDIQVILLSMRDGKWLDFNFGECDAVIHCAGIINSSQDSYDEYERVNVHLTRDLFAKCVEQKVPYFMYLSSMAVYDGTEWGFGPDGIITQDTKPIQKTYYGKSKYEAEQSITNQEKGLTKVCIVRAPSIVGKGMEDYFKNYIRFSKIPIFPIPVAHEEAKRSIVYVDTLIEFMYALTKEKKEGIFFPQNYPLLSVSEMYSEVCKVQRKRRIRMPICCKLVPDVIEKKLFRQICYAEELSAIENKKVDSISTFEAINRAINGGCING